MPPRSLFRPVSIRPLFSSRLFLSPSLVSFSPFIFSLTSSHLASSPFTSIDSSLRLYHSSLLSFFPLTFPHRLSPSRSFSLSSTSSHSFPFLLSLLHSFPLSLSDSPADGRVRRGPACVLAAVWRLAGQGCLRGLSLSHLGPYVDDGLVVGGVLHTRNLDLAYGILVTGDVVLQGV